MRNLIFVMAVAALFMAGCFGSAPPAPQNGSAAAPQNNTTAPQMPAAPGNNATPPAANETGGPSPAPAQQGGGTAPAPQVNCATLTPDCGSCIAVAGCGWCKTSNSCLSGDASGPASGQCPQADWAVTAQACQAPSSPQGTDCAQQVGCGSCLSGSGCKFCRQGAVCADSSSTEDCFGGWITNYYVCAAGSQ
jgi:hypothetical protein